jgi:hypothetical protein
MVVTQGLCAPSDKSGDFPLPIAIGGRVLACAAVSPHHTESCMQLHHAGRLAVVLLAMGAVACDSTNTGREAVSISFTTKAPGTALMAATQAANFDVTMTNGANTLIITKAQLVLREVELKLSATTTCATGTAADDCQRVQLGPTLIDLPVTDAVMSALSTQVPAGTYREIEFDIRRPGTDSADLAFVAANPNFNNVSIRVEGTYNGTPFVFTSELDQEVEIEFDPPVVITGDANNATIGVNVRSWFTNTDGTLINPATATVGQPNASLVANKIKASLRAFEDDDKSGS